MQLIDPYSAAMWAVATSRVNSACMKHKPIVCQSVHVLSINQSIDSFDENILKKTIDITNHKHMNKTTN